MRILIVSDAWEPQINGVVRTYQNLRDHLQAMGHIVRVIGPQEFPLRMPLPSYPEIPVAIGARQQLRRLVEEFQPDAIHIATEGTLGWAARNHCVRLGLPFTTSYHTHFPDYVFERMKRFFPPAASGARSLAIRTLRRFHRPSEGLMVSTQSLEDELRSWGFETPMRRLTRGVDLSLFKPEGTSTLFDQMQKPVALYVGRVAVEKNIEAFLDMEWAGSKVVVGNGPALSSLKARYPDAYFAGSQTGVSLADHYRSANLFVFPSLTDTFGIVMIEAMACGLPVAAYPVRGPQDVLTQAVMGAMDPDLSKAAQSALICGTPEERSAFVHTHHTWPAAATRFLDNLVPILREKP